MRKGLAVKLVYQGYLYEEIQRILGVSLGSITGWKQVYEENGIDGLRLNYKGRKSYLSTEQPEEVLSWLQTKDYWEIGELEYKLAFEYDVVYETKKSYYDLFKAAGISPEVNHKIKPKSRPRCRCCKKKEIETLLENNRNEIETGKLRALLIDECHLMWGDLSGYIWAAAFGGKLPPETCLGKTDQEIMVPVVNEREKQTSAWSD